jgi:peptidylprolyl isomerase
MKNTTIFILIAIIIVAVLGFVFMQNNKQSGEVIEPNPIATFKTNHGDIVIELLMDKMPITAGNFLKLAKEGFYDGTKFHRVISGFMIQGGDSNSKGDDVSIYGQGGPGYTIEDEFVEGLSNVRGTISMANTGAPNSGGSQFFINVANNTNLDFDKEPLASKHPVFGIVIEGMEVVYEIANASTGANDVPQDPITIEKVVIK